MAGFESLTLPATLKALADISGFETTANASLDKVALPDSLNLEENAANLNFVSTKKKNSVIVYSTAFYKFSSKIL